MPRSDLNEELLIIRKYCLLLLGRTVDLSFEDYLDDVFLRLGVERSLMIIGEAAVHIRNDYPVTFEQIAGLHQAIGVRNRIAHGYEDAISNESIWSILDKSLPVLLKEIDRVLT